MAVEEAKRRPSTTDVATRRAAVALVAEYVDKLDFWQNEAMVIVGHRRARSEAVAASGAKRAAELAAELRAALSDFAVALAEVPPEVGGHDVTQDVLRSLEALIRALQAQPTDHL